MLSISVLSLFLIFHALGSLIFQLFFIYYVPIFSPLLPSTQHPLLPQAIPTPLFLSLGHAISSSATPCHILYLTSPWLFSNYLFVFLNPLTSSSIPRQPFPSGNQQNALCIHDSVSVLLVCFVCY